MITKKDDEHGYGFYTRRYWKKGEIMAFKRENYYKELILDNQNIKVVFDRNGGKCLQGRFKGFFADGISDKLKIEQSKQTCYIPLHLIKNIERID